MHENSLPHGFSFPPLHNHEQFAKQPLCTSAMFKLSYVYYVSALELYKSIFLLLLFLLVFYR